MRSESELVLSECSPNGRWNVQIYIIPDEPYLRVDIYNIDQSVGCYGAFHGIGFGPYAFVSTSELRLRWDLPDSVLGFYVGADCYGLFRCGAGRRRNRGEFRSGLNVFTSDEIDWFCAKSHIQYKCSR
jgi:hypothetical protein